MIFEQDLRTFLLDADAVTAFVKGQIFGIYRPQGPRPLPELLIARTSTQRTKTFCGTNKLVSSDVTIDIYSMRGDESLNLARVLRQTLVDYRGPMAATWVDSVALANEFPVNDPDPGIVRMSQIYNFWYVED